jgi:hypothetical protein
MGSVNKPGRMTSTLFKPVSLIGKGTLAAPVKSSLVVQDITFTAAVAGVDGDLISVTYTDGASAGSEVVSVSGNAISVQLESGVSTATQVAAALTSAGTTVTDVATFSITGTAGTAQVAAVEDFLENGAGDLVGGPSFIASMKPAGTGLYDIVFAQKWISLQHYHINLGADSATTTTETSQIRILNADAVDAALLAGTAVRVSFLNSSMAEADLSAAAQVFFNFVVSESGRN